MVQSKYSKGERYNGSAPYGCIWDKKAKKLIVDQETAPVVKQIYEWCMEGYGPTQIARMLTEQNIPTPSAAYYKRTGVLKNKAALESPTLWDIQSIKTILSNSTFRLYIF